jgi:predicted O-linked N-acetylglucosamine transferase (SPINDLY family)
LQVFFNKPAPIQVSWAGYLASSGLKEIDYIIVDEYVAANLDEKNQFTEKLWKLKNTWSVLTPTNNVVLDNIPANNNGYITFGSFNNLKKINNKIIKLWSQILYQCKDSKLVLSTSQFKDKKFIEYFSKFFLDQGVKLEQLVLKEEANRNDLLNFYNTIDISLDTFPYNGGTTSLESIFMCVPVLTKKGNTFLSKCGESINTSIGLEDWIADNDEDYVLKAINFAKDFRKIQEVKSYLINNRNKFKLFDGKDFADQLSNSFKKMLQLT